ncbi:helix-turn-helix domain-containing protein [Jeotgalibacillus marinus]|uniref:Helix-turn-helix domain-containing protein n=1 Tax=Jeotgalibacillus marinus TaxID=86667 RepID=A0ABV3Q153_9BACL
MIGKNIVKIRKEKGLTLSELAEKADVSKSYLSNIERHIKQNPSIQVMEKIATVLDVDLNTLLEESSPENNNKSKVQEWNHFLNELKASGINQEQLREYRSVLEFIKWKNNQNKGLD